jgi:hypothetical protein
MEIKSDESQTDSVPGDKKPASRKRKLDTAGSRAITRKDARIPPGKSRADTTGRTSEQVDRDTHEIRELCLALASDEYYRYYRIYKSRNSLHHDIVADMVEKKRLLRPTVLDSADYKAIMDMGHTLGELEKMVDEKEARLKVKEELKTMQKRKRTRKGDAGVTQPEEKPAGEDALE